MRVEINVSDYSPQDGLRLLFEDDYTLLARIENGTAIIEADQGGLISLARFLLTLAQPDVPVGYHFHLDDCGGLEQGSCDLIFAKIASTDGEG